MVRKKGIAGLTFIAATLAVLAFAPGAAVAHPCVTAAQSFLSLDGGVGTGGLPTNEEIDCAVFNDSGTIADTTTAAAADVPDAVSTYTWTDNLTPLGHHARNVPNPGPSVFNSDLAFQGDYAYQGHYDGFRIIDVSDPANPTQTVNYQLRRHARPGRHVVYGNLLIRSWDAPERRQRPDHDVRRPARRPRLRGHPHLRHLGPGCPGHGQAAADGHGDSDHATGSAGRLRRPHRHDGAGPRSRQPLPLHRRLGRTCPGIDIVSIPISRPDDAMFLGVRGASRQCHDNNVIMGDVNLAMCAGGNGLSVFKFDPALDPASRAGSRTRRCCTRSPITGVSVGHSGSFTYDGKVLVFGHEPGGGTRPSARRPAAS